MECDSRTFLWDARASADAITRFIAGRTGDQYLTDEMLRAAVERHFEIIGEALNRLAQTDPAIATKVPDPTGRRFSKPAFTAMPASMTESSGVPPARISQDARSHRRPAGRVGWRSVSR
jgi:hypothetical protein